MIKYERILHWDRKADVQTCSYRYWEKIYGNLRWRGTGNTITLVIKNIGVYFEEVHGYHIMESSGHEFASLNQEGEFNRYEIRVRYQSNVHYEEDTWTFKDFFSGKLATFESCNYAYSYCDLAFGSFSGSGFISECGLSHVGTPLLVKTAFDETHYFVDIGVGANVNSGVPFWGGLNIAAEIRCGYGEGDHFGYRAFGEIGYTNTFVLPLSITFGLTYQNWEKFFTNTSFSVRLNVHCFI